ncbi:MAG: HAD hydrolase-like protein [Alphaproteobacteria bacterium]|nr:HAD hydrolase-like protein [Alphaproteobacteria bacterium]
MNYACLIFDLDGTLSDPKSGITKSINYALKSHNYDEISPDDLEFCIGPPLDFSFKTLTKREDSNHIDSLVSAYRERYASKGYKENVLYDGIKDILFEFKDKNIRMGVCTSKPERFARPILEMFGLMECFEFLSGGDVGIEKSSQLKRLLTENYICQNSIMIGDRKHDVIAAKENGLPSAGVLWGYGTEEEIVSHKPNTILAHVSNLQNLLL